MWNRGTYLLILAVLAIVVFGFMGTARWDSFSPSAYKGGGVLMEMPPGQEDSLSRAAFADGRLWLLSDTGALWSVREGRSEAPLETLPDPAYDLCVLNGAPVVMTAPRSNVAVWTIRKRTAGAWSELGGIETRGEGFVGIHCGADGLSLLTTRRLIQMQGARATALNLSDPTPRAGMSTLAETPTHLFVGLNVGEWGGGLRRIDKRTGKVEFLEGNATGDPCGGPLNTACDPVTGIAVTPWKPGCVTAAIGLVHMMTRGRLVEVCGGTVGRAYLAPCPYPDADSASRPRSNGEPMCTDAFFGLARHGDKLVAVGIGGTYVFDATGRVELAPLPDYRSYGPFKISFGRDFILVSTSANQRRSVSGYNPLLVPR